NDPNSDFWVGAPLMPLAMGDADRSFLTVSQTQYFLLNQWHAKAYLPGGGPALGPGERLQGHSGELHRRPLRSGHRIVVYRARSQSLHSELANAGLRPVPHQP